MNDQPRPDDPDSFPSEAADAASSPAEGPDLVEVSLVVPAPAYEVIDAIDRPDRDEGLEVDDPHEAEAEAEVSHPGPDPIDPLVGAMDRLGAELIGRIDRLQAVVDRELRAESSREKVVDRLHAELQDYKNDLLLKVTRPIFVDLIQLHDDMGKMADTLEGERAADLLRDFQQGIEDVLYRQGVEPFRVDGEGFDPRRQRAVSTVGTEEPARNKTIAARLRPGFASGEKVIRPELVTVYATRRAPSAESDAAGA